MNTLPIGVPFGNNDIYNVLMEKEGAVLDKLNKAVKLRDERDSFSHSFFSMTLQGFVLDFITSVSSIIRKVITSKKIPLLSNKEIFYLGIVIVIVAGLIMLAECSR